MKGNDMGELTESVRERAAQLLAEMIFRRSGAGGKKGVARASGPRKDAILAVFKLGVALSGDQVAEQLGVSGKDHVMAVKRTLGGMTRKDLDVKETPEGKVYSLKVHGFRSKGGSRNWSRAVGAYTVKKLLES